MDSLQNRYRSSKRWNIKNKGVNITYGKNKY